MKRSLFSCIAIIAICHQLQAQYQFTVEQSLERTPVEDQQQSNTCWSFATSSFLESELLRTGHPAFDLSEMYFVRQIYLDKARNYLLRQGKANFAPGGLSHDVIHAFDAYGAVPEDVYPGRSDPAVAFNDKELSVVMKAVLDGMIKNNVISEKWPAVINAILDIYLGPVSTSFTIGTEEFSPESYAKALDLHADDYVSITSFTHHPFYKKFVLEIPDNHANGSYYNVPLSKLVQIVDNALDKGYTIAWDGDVSEHFFSAEQGLAIVPEDDQRKDVFIHPGIEKSVSQESRQRGFENLATTDDHLMHIVGTATDQNGGRYYLVKNSWGDIGALHGYLYMSEAYFQLKTIAIMVHRDAIPAEIATHIEF